MSTVNLNPVRQCRGKHTYWSKAEAKAAIKRTQTALGRLHLGSDPLTPYRCPHCTAWHFGHRSKELKDRIQDHRDRCATAEEA